MNLALEYRPRRLSDVVGQRHVVAVLSGMIREGDAPPSMIFAGTRGVGKTSVGRIFAAAMNCTGEIDSPDACGACGSCVDVQRGSSLSVIEIDAASNGLVADIRKIRDLVSYAHPGAWRVVLLDEAQSMSKEAFNAILKVLEEPPPNTTFVLLTTEPERILGTVASRSMRFDFRRIGVDAVVMRLHQIAEAEQIPCEPDLLREIAVRSEGGLRDAVMVLDQMRRAGIKSAEDLREMLGVRDVAPVLLQAAVRGELQEGLNLIAAHAWEVGDYGQMVADLARCVRDLIAISAGAEPLSASVGEREVLAEIAGQSDVPRLRRVAKLMWDLRGRVQHTSDDQRTMMDTAFVLMCEALEERKRVTTEIQSQGGRSNGNGHQRLTLDAMRKMATGVSG